ncbi:DNA-binding protein [Burkholderia glumae]|uniref:DNA-binding protein n=1 Tax=Burkholderia glumae TaxID=337 RepID=UPI0020367117|nr:DNA-binding protein [Burkholderia glumae]MCM2491541.1 DNA-binding protein [Burkholderia glumae]
MKNENPIAHGVLRPFLTTEELALALAMSAQSIRKRYSATGSYFGLRPVKLPNRKLRWPADSLEQLMGKAA